MLKNNAAILITTYNWEEALEQVLHSITMQSCLPKEVVIADDGSSKRTADLIVSYQKHYPVPLIHCWQEDQGFRAAAIRNRAIAAMTAEYVVMIDGDMLLHKHFIRDHLRAAKAGFFVQGSRVNTSPCVANKLLSHPVKPVSTLSFFSPGIRNRFNTINTLWLSRIFSRVNNTIRATRTCNFSAWREDLLAINGFNEDYVGWGREDSDLVARLLHSGKQRLRLKFQANAYHIYHNENARDRLSENDKLLSACLRRKDRYCENGIDKYRE